MTRKFPLTNGMVALVDDEHFDWLVQWVWRPVKGGNTWYATRRLHSATYPKTAMMHRQIMGAIDGFYVDHVDGDGLNNTLANLRFATRKQNSANRGVPRNNKSGYKGVIWHKQSQKWNAYIMHNYKGISLGYFDNPEDAARAYNDAAIKYFGEFARPNKIDSSEGAL